MMDIKKNILYITLGILGYFIWLNWQQDFPSQKHSTKIINSRSANTSSKTKNIIEDQSASVPADTTEYINPTSNIVDSANIVHIKTDVYNIELDHNKANIINAALLNYPISVKQPNKYVQLMYSKPTASYTANNQWLVLSENKPIELSLSYSTPHTSYIMSKDQNILPVEFTANKDGVLYKVTYIFKRSSYLIDVNYEVINNTEKNWSGYLNNQLVQTNPKEDESSLFHVGSYSGGSWSNPKGNHYKKVSYSQMDKNDLEESVKGGWIAMQQHYFLSSWIPETGTINTFYTRSQNGEYRIGMVSKPLVLAPSAKLNLNKKLYIGPEDVVTLQKIAPALDLTVDYGWLWFVSTLLFSIMKKIYQVVGNWGWTIILVTIFIKLAFYQLSAKSYRSMSGMKSLQPKLQKLKEKYGDDKVKLSQATMELYKQEKINPMGGCLPILIQIPVFIGLYWVLIESVELRQAPFILWIHDLASPDQYHVLPIIMGLTMFIQQKLNPAPADPAQAKVMMFLPVLFTGLFWGFPAGLVLYWIVNNTLSILQQWYITHKFNQQNK